MIEAKKKGAVHLKAIIQMDYDALYNNKDDKIVKSDIDEAKKCGLEIWSFNNLINSVFYFLIKNFYQKDNIIIHFGLKDFLQKAKI